MHHPTVSCFADLLVLFASTKLLTLLVDSIHIPQFVHALCMQ